MYFEESIESLKLKVKSATKLRLTKESEVLKFRTKERNLLEELHVTKSQVEGLSDELEALKNQIGQSIHQRDLINICSTSEDTKIAAHIETLNIHMGGFQRQFDRERHESEQRKMQQMEKIAEHQKNIRQKEMQKAEANTALENEIVVIERECEIIEQECAVLKKRNNAIMLKLRKQLLEAETNRRKLMKGRNEN